ncbi:hypothetical protein [Cellulomonas sp. P5_C5]
MHRTAAATALLVVALAACSAFPAEPGDGVGQLVVADLETPSQHFTGAPVPLTARVDVTSTGCVTVVVDDVERYPFWPDDTTVTELPDELGTYVVTLPDGTTLTTGESFEGDGVVDDSTAPFEEGLVASLLGFCAIEAAPVAFFDASAIVPVD